MATQASADEALLHKFSSLEHQISEMARSQAPKQSSPRRHSSEVTAKHAASVRQLEKLLEGGTSMLHPAPAPCDQHHCPHAEATLRQGKVAASTAQRGGSLVQQGGGPPGSAESLLSLATSIRQRLETSRVTTLGSDAAPAPGRSSR